MTARLDALVSAALAYGEEAHEWWPIEVRPPNEEEYATLGREATAAIERALARDIELVELRRVGVAAAVLTRIIVDAATIAQQKRANGGET